jgi:16S rRNA pseudouridine516 synthase
MKLNRLVGKHRYLGRSQAQRAITEGRVKVDGVVITDGVHWVDRFTAVTLDEEVIQQAERALYLMLHKPVGYLSATVDAVHPTVIDLVDLDAKHSLHLAGRLDRSTSGLVLLSNDGRWTERITRPQGSVPKVYRVVTHEPMKESDVAAFAAGFYFHTEDITTLPAELVILEECCARLTLHEGRYHQIKRMFHRLGNRVKSLHRESIGALSLTPELLPGFWRMLTDAEVKSFGEG